MLDDKLEKIKNVILKNRYIMETYNPVFCTGKAIKEYSNVIYNLFEEDKWRTGIAYGKSQGWHIGIRFYSDKISHWMLCDLKTKHKTIYDAYQNNDIPTMKLLAKLAQLTIHVTFENQDCIEHSIIKNGISELEKVIRNPSSHSINLNCTYNPLMVREK